MANEDIFSMLKVGQNAASKISKTKIARLKETDVSGNLNQVNQSILSKDFNLDGKYMERI